MEDTFEDMPEFNPYFDDPALGASSTENHCQLLHKILTSAKEANLESNLAKIQLLKSSEKYLGYILFDKDIEPESKKIKAIIEFPALKNR